MFYYFFLWKCFTVAAFSVLISFVILWFVFLVKGGQVVPRSVFLLFFLLLLSVSWRSLTWFWVRFRKVVFLSSLLQHWPPFRQCLNIDPSTQSGTKAQATLAEQAPTSNSDFRQQILIFNSDFPKQTSPFKLRFSKTNFHFPKHTLTRFKFPFSKANSFIQTPFSENKLPFFKANFDFPIQFFENKLRFSTKQTPIFQVKLRCPFKPPYIYPSRRNTEESSDLYTPGSFSLLVWVNKHVYLVVL